MPPTDRKRREFQMFQSLRRLYAPPPTICANTVIDRAFARLYWGARSLQYSFFYKQMAPLFSIFFGTSGQNIIAISVFVKRTSSITSTEEWSIPTPRVRFISLQNLKLRYLHLWKLHPLLWLCLNNLEQRI
ncbi:hypothetical protein AB6A40_009115 [Gnathostoma spinigerum]|uniref:Uncharacterized protein n=1 Tax=Gnathostoma spinigerum TaxID=75299 RepID=A0ABD6EY51_9BILA